MTTTMQRIEAAVSNGRHTGDIIWWALRNAEVDEAAFVKAWQEAGLPKEALGETPGPARLLKKCAEDALRGFQKPTGDLSEMLLRPVTRKDGKAIFALVREKHDGKAERNEYDQLAMVAVDEKSGQFLTDQGEHPAVKAIHALYTQRQGRFFAGGVAAAVLSAIDIFGGISLRGSGGVYWIPAAHAEQVRALKRVVDNVGGSRFDVLPVHDSQEGNAALAEAARSTIEAKVDSLASEMNEWLSRAGGPDAKASTLVARMTEYEALKVRASGYARDLGAKLDDLLGRMDSLKTHAQGLLDAEFAAMAAVKQEKAEAKAAEKAKREAVRAKAKADKAAAAAKQAEEKMEAAMDKVASAQHVTG